MEIINYDEIYSVIKEILDEVKLSLDNIPELNNFERINLDIFADQIRAEYEDGALITKKYISQCIMKVVKDKNL